MNRVIGHLDLDYFYAQVEEVANPSIRDRPVIVCVFSGRTEQSGVVSTANYRARELGVRSGMPIVTAKKRLEGTDPTVIGMEREKYKTVSDRIMKAIRDKVDILEQSSIDEAFFDISISTGGDYGEARNLGLAIKESILNTEHLSCSIGIGRSKVVAKLGSDMAKPGGLILVVPEQTESFLGPLPVAMINGVGPKTSSILGELGIHTIGGLAQADKDYLAQRFGTKFATFLMAASTGTDTQPVIGGLEPTQYSRIVTLKEDTRDPHEAFAQLAEGIGYLHDRLALARRSFRTMTSIGILTDLSTHTKSKSFDAPVNDLATIKETSLLLLIELSKSVDKDFRRVGLRVSGLAVDEEQKSISDFLQNTG